LIVCILVSDTICQSDLSVSMYNYIQSSALQHNESKQHVIEDPRKCLFTRCLLHDLLWCKTNTRIHPVV